MMAIASDFALVQLLGWPSLIWCCLSFVKVTMLPRSYIVEIGLTSITNDVLWGFKKYIKSS